MIGNDKAFTTNVIGWRELALKVTIFTNKASKSVVYLYLIVATFYMPIMGTISIVKHIHDSKNLLSVGFYLKYGDA